MKAVNIILMGFGNVGKAFLHVVKEKQDYCLHRYGLDFRFSAIFEIDGALFYPQPLDAGEILDDLSLVSSYKISSYWKSELDLTNVIDSVMRGVLVECTPSDSKTGKPGLNHIRLALDGGWHVATANKGPLVVDFRGLKEKAKKNKSALKISGATAAALPTLDVALYSLAGTEISRIEGILNGTTNFILTKMRDGLDYQVALKEAQARGIAEPDPTLDVEGWDTAYKILLIANAVFDRDFSLDDVKREGITAIPSSLLKEGREEDKALKLLGVLSQAEGQYNLNVELTIIDRSHPLFGVDGVNKGIHFVTDTMASVTVTGGKSDPKGAAAALLKDIINIYR